MATGIEPGEAATQRLDEKLPVLQIGVVNVGDFQLTAPRRFDGCGDLDHTLVIKIESRDSHVAAWLHRLLDDGDDTAVAVELGNPVTLRIVHWVHEDGRTLLACDRVA